MEQTTGSAPAPAGRTSGWRTASLIVGSIVALVALALLAAGGTLLWAETTERDADGFYSTSAQRFSSPTHAVRSDELELGSDVPQWVFERDILGQIRITATGEDGVFVGIAPTEDVERYLAGVEHDRVQELEYDPFSVTYERSGGGSAPAEPGSEEFWTASAEGSGRQSVTWEVESGNWSVVVMNADASRGVEADVALAAKVSFVRWVGIGILAVGLVFAAGAAALLYFGLRRPRYRAPVPTS